MLKSPVDTIFTFLRQYWPTMCVVAVIMYATFNSDPLADVDVPLFPGADKLIHAIMFGGLAGAVAFDYQRVDRGSNRLTRRVMLTVCVACAVAGVLDEIAQATLTAERSGDILDWLADCAGIIVAFFAAPPAIRKVLRISAER